MRCDHWNQGPEEMKLGNQTTSTPKVGRVDFVIAGPGMRLDQIDLEGDQT